MGIIDYRKEPRSDIAFVDMRSFYASVECVERGLDPLTTSLCVMSSADNSRGLILAASPTFKRVFGMKNVGRSYDLPFNMTTRKFNFARAVQAGETISKERVDWVEDWAQRTLFVPPRMGRYIEYNLEIQSVLRDYAPAPYVFPYSIDEAFVDLTGSLSYFCRNQSLSRRERLAWVGNDIQRKIRDRVGVYATLGMSNANPLLAKLALDNDAKKQPDMMANWSYEDVETKVWAILRLTDFWGIGSRTARRLQKLGIESVRDLANANPDQLKAEFGIIGLQLFFHANGVDESKVTRPYYPKSKGLGNSQVLPRDYTSQRDIELVLMEMAEQVAIRLRRAGKKAQVVSIFVGYSRDIDNKSIQVQQKIPPTHRTDLLQKVVLDLFRQRYHGGPVRNIGIRYGDLVDEAIHVFSLFENYEQGLKQERLQATLDQVRQKYGHLAVLPASALEPGSRTIARSKLIGGHSAGGLDGLNSW